MVSVCVCVPFFGVLQINPQESWMKQSAHLSLSNPNLVLSSCVPMGNVCMPLKKMRSYPTSLGAQDRCPGHANQCGTTIWQLGAGKHAFIKSPTHAHTQLARTYALIVTHGFTHSHAQIVLLLWSSSPESPAIIKNN